MLFFQIHINSLTIKIAFWCHCMFKLERSDITHSDNARHFESSELLFTSRYDATDPEILVQLKERAIEKVMKVDMWIMKLIFLRSAHQILSARNNNYINWGIPFRLLVRQYYRRSASRLLTSMAVSRRPNFCYL